MQTQVERSDAKASLGGAAEGYHGAGPTAMSQKWHKFHYDHTELSSSLDWARKLTLKARQCVTTPQSVRDFLLGIAYIMTANLSRRPPSLFKGPRTHAANGRRTRRGMQRGTRQETRQVAWRGTRWGFDVARTNRHDGTEQAGTCLQRTTIGRRLRKVDYDRLPKYPSALPRLAR